MKKFILYSFLIIIIPIVSIISFLKFVDFNNYKPQIEELALKYANINLKIDGDIKVGISLKPSVEINNVQISDSITKNKISEVGNALVQFSLIPLLKKEIQIDTIQTSNTKIYYSKENSVYVSELIIETKDYNSPINIMFDTKINDININGEGKISSLKQIKENNFNAFYLETKTRINDYVINYKGNITDIKRSIFISGNYSAQYKENIINGSIDANMQSKTPYLKLDIKGDTININDFFERKISENSLFISNAYASDLIPNSVIPYELLSTVDAEVSLNIKRILLNDIIMDNILGIIQNKNSVFKADIKNINIGTGSINGLISINSNNKSINVNVDGKNIIISELYKDFSSSENKELSIKEEGKSTFNITLHTQGNDVNHCLSNLSGQVIGIIDKSVLKIKSLEAFKGGIISQILNTININVLNRDLSLQCAVVRGDINKGEVFFPKGVVFKATDFYLVADGSINLNNDKIDFNLQPFSGKIKDTNVSSLLGSLLKIKGTVTQPKLGINQTQTAKSVIGAIASGGAYNVSDLLLSVDSQPCFTALKGTTFSSYFPEDKSLKNNITKTYNNTEKAIKDLGKQAGNLLKGIIKDVAK